MKQINPETLDLVREKLLGLYHSTQSRSEMIELRTLLKVLENLPEPRADVDDLIAKNTSLFGQIAVLKKRVAELEEQNKNAAQRIWELNKQPPRIEDYVRQLPDTFYDTYLTPPKHETATEVALRRQESNTSDWLGRRVRHRVHGRSGTVTNDFFGDQCAVLWDGATNPIQYSKHNLERL